MVVPDCLSRAPVVEAVESIELAPDYEKNECYSPNCKQTMIENSEKEIFTWIECEKCVRWYHLECVGLSEKQAKEKDTWYCEEFSVGIDSSDNPFPDIQSFVTIPEKEVFITEQRSDPKLSQIYDFLEDKILPESKSEQQRIRSASKQYQLLKKVLVLKKKKKHVVVPATLKKAVIINYHSRPTASHLGKKKTLWRIVQKYYWRNMKNDVKDLIKKCRACQFCKPSYKKATGLMKSIFTTSVNELFSADVLDRYQKQFMVIHNFWF